MSSHSSASSRPVLVLGATGTVGKEVVRALLARSAPVAALVRTRPRAAGALAGVELVLGDLGDASAVRRAVERASAVFFVNPHEPDEETYAEHVVTACEQAQAPLVYLGTHVDARWAWLRAVLRTTYGTLFPTTSGVSASVSACAAQRPRPSSCSRPRSSRTRRCSSRTSSPAATRSPSARAG